MNEQLHDQISELVWKWFLDTETGVDDLAEVICEYVIKTYGPPF